MATHGMLGWATLLFAAAAASSLADPPASQSSKTHTVAKGSLLVSVEGDATFEAVDSFELRIRPKAYAGDLTVVSAVENGAAVKKGDALLQLDATSAKRDVAAAENDLVLARANLRKAQEDVRLGAAADKVALDATRQALADAKTNLKWFDEVDGPNALKMADLQLKEFNDGIGDQQDELDQLRKMYKSEELTSATADIVVKRAVRRLDRTREQLPVAEAAARKAKDVANPQARFAADIAVTKAQVALDQLQVAQEQGKIAREAALVTAQIAAARAEQKLGELRADLEQLTVAAPTDGVAMYGGVVAGQWQNANPKALRPGDKVAPQVVVLTLVESGKLRAVIAVPEGKLSAVRAGAKAQVSPKLLPELKYAGKVASIARVAGTRGGATGYDVQIDLPQVDARLSPAMTASVKIEPEKLDGVLVVPSSAIANGKVTVRADGKDQEREVTAGRTDGKMTEVVAGLAEGDQVVLK